MQLIKKYFPDLSQDQYRALEKLGGLYSYWNRRINVISRKDIQHLYLHHVLHSLVISRISLFKNGRVILDAGTGGGFPGIPLAILSPDKEFTLLDSVRKKIIVVDAVCSELGLKNTSAVCARLEDHRDKYHTIISRAVTGFPRFVGWVAKNLGEDAEGIVSLKGGELETELSGFKNRVRILPVSDFFSEDYFRTKKIICLPAASIAEGES